MIALLERGFWFSLIYIVLFVIVKVILKFL